MKPRLKNADSTPLHPAPFTQLPTNLSSILSPLLTFEDKINVMETYNKSVHLFFSTTFYIEKLLHHVYYGEPKNAKAMIEKNPRLLLQTGRVTCKHTGDTLRGTPLRIALRVKDLEMIVLFLSHMDSKNIAIQMKAQFPQGYEDYKKAEAKKIQEGYKKLETAFKAIESAEVEVIAINPDLDILTISIDKKTESVLNDLRGYLKPKGIIETGEDITDMLVAKAFELYHSNFYPFSTQPDSLHLSPKNVLAWRLVGIVQRHLMFHDIQAMSEGPDTTSKKKNTGKPQGRTLIFGQCFVQDHFLSMVSDSVSGLGVDYAISGGHKGSKWKCGLQHGGKSFINLSEAKNLNLKRFHARLVDNTVKRKQIAP